MLNEPDDTFDARLGTGWNALAPPSDARARVRARLAASGVIAGGLGMTQAGADDAGMGGAGTRDFGVAPPGARASVAQGVVWRWQALLSSGGVGAGVGVLLLGAGFFAGYRSRPSSPEPVAPSVVAAAATLAVPALLEPPTIAPHAVVSPGVALPAASTAPDSRNASAAAASSSAGERPARAGAGTASPSRRPGRGVRAAFDDRETGREARLESCPERRRAGVDRSAARDELLLLDRAERALRTHDPALATALIDEAIRCFPRSSLLEERGAIELMARCQAGGDPRAVASLRAGFERRYPKSVYAERVARDCDAFDASRSTNGAELNTEGVKGDQHDQTP